MLKGWMISLRGRLILLAVAFAIAYVAGIYAIRVWQVSEISETFENEVAERGVLLESLLALKGESLHTLAYDYTFWDEMVQFVEAPDTSWARSNLEVSLTTYDADICWVFGTAFDSVYSADILGDLPRPPATELISAIRQSAPDTRQWHFFAKTGGSLFEIRGATVHPTDDEARRTEPRGYFFVGRFWGADQLADLSDLLRGEIALDWPRDTVRDGAGEFSPDGTITLYKALHGWDGAHVAALVASKNAPEIAEHSRIAGRMHVLTASLMLGLLLAVGWILNRWVALPLRKMSRALDTNSVDPIAGLLPHRSELGQIAQSLKRFLRQQENLLREMERRALAEKALQFTQFSVDHAALGIFWIDCKGRITYVNRAACRYLEFTEEELLRRTMFEIDPIYDFGGWEAQWEGLRRQGHLTIESRHQTKSGRRIAVEVLVNFLESSDGGTACVFVRDISERKRAETEKTELEAQLRKAQRLETVGTLAGGIAHDFNNLLTPILGHADILLHKLEPDDASRTDVRQISSAALRARDLVRHILAFSRQVELERAPVRLQHVVEAALPLLRSTLPSTIVIREQVDRECGPVLCDASQIHQVLMNLCTNAAHAMKENGGLLDVALESVELRSPIECRKSNLNEGSYVCLTVRDNGCGIDKDILDRIFEPFFTTKPPGEGTGLGLAVAHGIIASHHGGIVVESVKGSGTTFRIYLPRMLDTGEAAARPDDCEPKGTERVLFVDDEDAVIVMGKSMLEALGYSVTAFRDATTALDTFRANPDAFDVMVTDQMMPDLAGDGLARSVLGIRPGLPIVLITGFSERVTEQSFRALGIRELVMKPLLARELGCAIRRAVLAAPRG